MKAETIGGCWFSFRPAAKLRRISTADGTRGTTASSAYRFAGDKDQVFWFRDGDRAEVAAGGWRRVEFDNSVLHGVRNDSTRERITLIVCCNDRLRVFALPRSGTAWLANWLTTDRSLCLHDPSRCRCPSIGIRRGVSGLPAESYCSRSGCIRWIAR